MHKTGNSGIIDHEGIVRKVDNNSVVVSIKSSAACSGCHAEGSCNMSGQEEKIIDISGRYNVKPGDSVTVLMKQSMGYNALFLGYVLPVIIVLFTLILMVSLDAGELSSGLISLSTLLPYYLILFLFRSRINKIFTFTLKV